jgi:RNA polymerase sigma-70 factor (ECF subfamily)
MNRESAASVDEQKEIFRVLYARSYGPIRAYVRRRTRRDNASEADVVAEVFLVAWRRLADVPAPPKELPWLYGVARNVLNSHFRTTQRSLALVQRISNEERVGDHSSSGPSDIELRVEHAISQFSDVDREIFRLIHWESLSHDEVAIAMDLTAKAVERRVARSRSRVREILNVSPSTMSTISPEQSRDNAVRINERNIS